MTTPHLMIIAGAGASFDSDLERDIERYVDGNWERWRDPFASERIPLAKDLFGRRFGHIQRKYPRVQSLAIAVMGALGKFTVEEFLGDYRERMQGDPNALAKLMAARYYIAHLIREQEDTWYRNNKSSNNWMALLEYLQSYQVDIDQQVTITTTNYDRLIEFAITQVSGKSFSHIAHYTRDDRTNVLKLHGSVDWQLIDTMWARPDNENSEQWLIDNAAVIEEPTTFVHEEQEFDPKLRRIPAIAIPVKKKTTFTCPEPMKQRFHERLAAATHLLVIGWRGEDPHIADVVRAHATNLRHITCVGPKLNELETLKNNIRPANVMENEVVIATMGFSQFVSRSEQLEALLSDIQRTV